MGAPSTETVMQRAARQFSTLTEADVDGLARFEAGWCRDMAVHFLQQDGIVLVGDSTLVDYAISQAAGDIAEAFELLKKASAKPKRGRPANDVNTNLIYAAAWMLFSNASSRTETARRAARFLGAPATKDRVEKGVRAHLRFGSRFVTAAHGSDQARRFILNIISDTALDLTRIAQKLEAEKAEAEVRRKSGRHAVFNGAAPDASLVSFTRETKR